MTLVVGFRAGQDHRSGVELAATLARSSGDDLLLVTVVPAPWPTPVAGGTDREFEEWAEGLGKQGVEEAEALLEDHCPSLSARAIWVSGRSIPGALLEEADKVGARLIVIGSGDAGGYGHVSLSTTGDRLLHSSHIPVAVATRGYYASEHGRVTRVTCAFRGDKDSWRTLERTAEICRDEGVGLRIATFAVRGRTMYPPEVGTKAEDMVMDRWTAQASQLQAEALEHLETLGARPGEVEAEVSTGRSWVAAVDGLHWDRDELLVVGSSSASFMSRLFLGANASKIVRYSPVPVVVVP